MKLFGNLNSFNPFRTETIMYLAYHSGSNRPDGVDAQGHPKRMIHPEHLVVSVEETKYFFGYAYSFKETRLPLAQNIHGEFWTQVEAVKRVVVQRFSWADTFLKDTIKKIRELPELPSTEECWELNRSLAKK